MDVLEGAFRPHARADGGRHSHASSTGPITYTIDGAPLVGPIPGKRNAFCIIGLRGRLGEGGGHGWLLAQQIVHGEACYDTWVLDPRRFTGHCNVELTALKAIEDYQNEFRFHFPHEHRPAGRPAKTTPLTPISGSRRRGIHRGEWLGAGGLHQTNPGIQRNPFGYSNSPKFLT